MEFTEYASRETSDLVALVVAGASDVSHQRVAALRAALAAATDGLDTALTAGPEVEGAVAALVERLRAAAATDAQAALDRAREGAEATAAQAANDAKAAADALRAELDRRALENDALQSALTAAVAETERLRGETGTVASELETARRELTEARTIQKRLETARLEMADARDREAAAHAVLEAELRPLRTAHENLLAESARYADQLDTAAAERQQLEDSLDAARTQVDAAEAKLAAVTALLNDSAARVRALERQARDHARKQEDPKGRPASATAARAGVETESLLDSVIGGFEALAGATSIPDVLTTLVEQLAAEFPRVARFRVKGNRLQGEHHIGFDLKNDIAKVVVPLSMDSLLTRAVVSGRLERLTGEALSDTSSAPLGGSPTYAVALPVVVSGETLGVIYADDSGQRGDVAAYEARSKFAEALLQHAVALLTRLTTELGTMAELRAYATSLVTEIEQMHSADVSAGRNGSDLRNRLKANVEYARSIYANRVAFECPDAAALLDDEFEAVVEAHRGTPFAADLGALAGQAHAPQQHRTA